MFSSLAGLEFEWSVLPDTSTEGEEMVDILRYGITIKQTYKK